MTAPGLIRPAAFPIARVTPSPEFPSMPLGATLTLFSALVFIAYLPIWPWSRRFSAKPAIVWGVIFLVCVLLWVTVLI